MILSKVSSKFLFSAQEKTTTENRLPKPKWTPTSPSQNKASAPPISLSQRTTKNPHLWCIRPKLLALKGPTLTRNLRPKQNLTWSPSLQWDSWKATTCATIHECKWPSKIETPSTFPPAPIIPRKTKYLTSLQSGRSKKKNRQNIKVTVLVFHLPDFALVKESATLALESTTTPRNWQSKAHPGTQSAVRIHFAAAAAAKVTESDREHTKSTETLVMIQVFRP
jgi:hypothetical protein